MRICLVCLALLCSSFFLKAESVTPQTQKEPLQSSESLPRQVVTLQLKWKHQFQFAGYYAAKEKGFYKDAGFNVTLKEAYPGLDPIQEVVEGRADYGIANSELILYRMNGAPVTALSVIIQHSPIVLMTLKKNKILSPQDLIGKKVMYPEGHYGANTLGIFMKEGIPKTQFESIPLSFNIQDLINGNVDAMVGYVTDQPYLLKEQNIQYNLIDPRSYGIDFYGDTLFTHSTTAKDDREAVKRFRDATLKGWEYALQHPNEIITTIKTKYKSAKSIEELQYEATETIKLIVPKLVQIGHMNPGRWQHIADTFYLLGMAKTPYQEDNFIFNPEGEFNSTLQQILYWSLGILVASLLAISALIIFNRKLSDAVKDKTKDLSDLNSQLINNTKQLMQHEIDLQSLNSELEERVKQRTESLKEVNDFLLKEIQQRKERELSLLLLSKAIENSSSAVLIIKDNGIVEYASTAFLKITGLSAPAVEGQHINSFKDILPLPEFDPIPLLNDENDLFSSHLADKEIQCKSLDQKNYWLKTTVSPLLSEDTGNSHYVIVCEDITDIKQRKDQMEKMALYDALTGLENRVLFKIRLQKAIDRAQRHKVKTALLFIDIDHFKEINDTFGHDAGDTVLKTISDRMRSKVRQNDPIARISGDEFTILLSDINDFANASKITQSILESFKEPILVQSSEVFVTASIGISVTPDDSTNIDQLIKHADLAMYQAKLNGRNNYQYFSQEMNQEVTRKAAIEQEIRQGLEEKAFFLTFQPKVCLKTQQCISAEALVRWKLNDGRIRNPDEFIPIAEESGLIIPLGLWIIEEAILSMQKMINQGIHDIKFSVNVSPRQLKDHNFVSHIIRLFETYSHLICYFELEITENSFIDDQTDNIERLNQLKEIGFTISIDDFGTGYSSLSYLKRLPIDTIKIDRSFIKDLPEDTNNAEITSAVIAMAHKLNLSVVAEGVETEDQKLFLANLNCDIAQGYHYGRPMRLENLIDYFKQQNDHTQAIQAVNKG